MAATANVDAAGVFERVERRLLRGRDGGFRADDRLRWRRGTPNGWWGEACDSSGWCACSMRRRRGVLLRGRARCTWVASPWRGRLAATSLQAIIEQACLGEFDGGMLSYAFIEVSW